MASFNADAPGKRVLGGSSLLGQQTELPYCPADFLPKSTGPVTQHFVEILNRREGSLSAARPSSSTIRTFWLTPRQSSAGLASAAGQNQTFIACRWELNS